MSHSINFLASMFGRIRVLDNCELLCKWRISKLTFFSPFIKTFCLRVIQSIVKYAVINLRHFYVLWYLHSFLVSLVFLNLFPHHA